MLILIVTCSLFLFAALSIGYITNRFLTGESTFNPPLFQILLCGTAALTVYLNIISLSFPADYFALIPLLLTGGVICLRTTFLKDVSNKLKVIAAILFNKKNRAVTISMFVVLSFFAIVPPFNTDMGGYHILSILWNEKFAVVPGLANLFSQFGFNTSFFVLSSALSFTDVFNHSVYPVNIVLIPAFYGWMLMKSFDYNDWRKPLLLLLLIIFFRQFLINLSAPSPDALFMMIVFYVFLQLSEKKRNESRDENYVLIAMLSMFAVIIKISALPLLLLILILLFRRELMEKRVRWITKVSTIGMLIFIPWVIRNIIISGYLIFPVPLADVFSFDWKVPFDIVVKEKQHISNAPRMISADFSYADQLPVTEKFIRWLPGLWSDDKFNFTLICLAFLSPLFVLFGFRSLRLSDWKVKVWLVAYAGILFWFIGSPDIRFGFPYLISTLILPSLFVASKYPFSVTSIVPKAISFFIVVACGYYVVRAVGMLRPYRVEQFVVKPLKHPEYLKNNDLKTFRYVMLENSIRLYIHDSAHHTINAPLPGCAPYREGIRMRGKALQEGFKTIE